MCSTGNRRIAWRGAGACSAFTLVELLVVVSIIALLISILLPNLIAAQRSARALQCASNLRQLGTALLCYAGENKGRFPPNIQGPNNMFWYDSDRIGRYISGTVSTGGWIPGGPVFTCPEDSYAIRSYAMNVWASSKVEKNARTALAGLGTFWDARVPQSSRMILFTEVWSHYTQVVDGPCLAFPWVGGAGTPGQRFGADGGNIGPTDYHRWGVRYWEITYLRHGPRFVDDPRVPRGCLNIAYADGHVALRASTDLVDLRTGLSTLDSLWSPLDLQLNIPIAGPGGG